MVMAVNTKSRSGRKRKRSEAESRREEEYYAHFLLVVRELPFRFELNSRVSFPTELL